MIPTLAMIGNANAAIPTTAISILTKRCILVVVNIVPAMCSRKRKVSERRKSIIKIDGKKKTVIWPDWNDNFTEKLREGSIDGVPMDEIWNQCQQETWEYFRKKKFGK